ncbi:unnamed protein product [Owenia fusiformis]|uniref:N-acetylglucosaminylphosphatidylinositol deacetylase n=1 Tax=Owenia fusiformis TaxID=6347 RepID=A0A8S4QAP4_OWEFU|nr:unnamed protein product [Owenia fusiformis]
MFLWLLGPVLVLIAVIFGIHRSLSSTLDTRNPFSTAPKTILVITAHPDDECMFFGPTIQYLTRIGHEVSLLCLSVGNYYGKGKERIKEFYLSANILGVPHDKCAIIDDISLQDGPGDWDLTAASNIIEKHLHKLGANSIITFDEHGVSGHPNHKAIYWAVRNIHTKDSYKGIPVYTLKTTNTLRKYISIFDIPYSFLTSKILFLSTWTEFLKSQKAMLSHWSQLVWFRWLYIATSRYMLMNTLNELEIT